MPANRGGTVLVEQDGDGYAVVGQLYARLRVLDGLSNRRTGGRAQVADADFVRQLKGMRRIQDSEAIGFRIEIDKETGKRERLAMFFAKSPLPSEVQSDREALRKLLHLDPDRQDFPITYGPDTGRNDTIAIASGATRPDSAFVAMRYRDLWYRIDDHDLRSKGVFTFLLILLTLADTSEKGPAPVLTSPAN